MPTRALMLLNPAARRGEQALEVLPELQALGLEVTLERFSSAEEVSADIVRRAPGFDLVILCGGDGTIASAADGLLQTGLPMGVLPLGTANDLARTLGLPLDLKEACRVIARGKRRRIDVGLVNGKAFFNVASLGLSADMAKGLTRERKRRFGRLAYALQALQVLTSARPFSAVIESRSGSKRVRTLQIAVGNGRHYGGGQVVHANAAIDDGHLDLYSLSPKAVWKLALMFGRFRSGHHGAWAEVTTARCTDFWLKTSRPMPINTDGDIHTHTPAHFVVRPDAVEVFVP
jgi:YegS/Rv2252/BmrU family lipid kinase